MYLPILHPPRVKYRCKLQEKLHRVTGFNTCMLSIPILTLYHKVNWLKSERKTVGKIVKSRWCSGGAGSSKGEDRFLAGPRAHLGWFQSGKRIR